MKALISKIEPRESGYRVAQVEQDDNIFDVAEDLFWTDCPDECVADIWFYNPESEMCEPIPQPEPEPIVATEPTKEELLAKLLEIQAQLQGMQ